MNDETTIERTPRNAAKKEILDTIRTLGQVTATEIALVTNRTPEAASMALLRYHKQGLISRDILKGRTKIYELTPRGRERLVWLEQSFKIE